jgi:hypothetical protein
MNRRDFLLSTAVAVPLSKAITLSPPRRVRIHLVDWPAGTPIEHARAVAEMVPTRSITVAAQKRLSAWKLGDALVADTTHTAESLQPGDAVAKRRIQNGDLLDPTTQLRVVCSVEVMS